MNSYSIKMMPDLSDFEDVELQMQYIENLGERRKCRMLKDICKIIWISIGILLLIALLVIIGLVLFYLLVDDVKWCVSEQPVEADCDLHFRKIINKSINFIYK